MITELTHDQTLEAVQEQGTPHDIQVVTTERQKRNEVMATRAVLQDKFRDHLGQDTEHFTPEQAAAFKATRVSLKEQIAKAKEAEDAAAKKVVDLDAAIATRMAEEPATIKKEAP